MPDLYRGNQADKDLDMRPAHHEPECPESQAASRFDIFRTEPTLRIPKVGVEYLTTNDTLLAPGHYFYAPYEAGSAGPLIFDHHGVSAPSINCAK